MTQVNMTQAANPADPTPPTLEGKLALLRKLRDELGSGDTIRRLFFGDLEPIALQPGGANTVVHLYNKANDVTIAYCTSYDVFLAARKGRVTEFDQAEIKKTSPETPDSLRGVDSNSGGDKGSKGAAVSGL